jgi:hypothetical protein
MNKEQYKSILDARIKFNTLLINEIAQMLTDNPSMRFGQAVALFFKNDTNERQTHFESLMYNEEPAETFARISGRKDQ